MARRFQKCIYGRQECQLIKSGKCPRQNQCPYAAKLRAESKAKTRLKVGAS